MKSTITDIARAAKVSVGSVSSVLNNKAEDRRISKDTVTRIRQAAERLGYVPNFCARGLRTQRTQNLGEIVDISIQHSYLVEIISHLETHAKQHGYYVNIGVLHNEADALHYTRSFGANRCDAVLVVSVTINDKLDRQFKELRAGGTPVVLVYCGENPDYDCVCPNLYRSAILGTEYLVRRGHRTIACVGQRPEAGLGNEYLAGMREVLSRHRLAFDDSQIYECPADFHMAATVWDRIMAERPECTGFMAFNDDIALGLAHGARRAGRRIPEDIEIVAQNNTYPVRISESPLASTYYDLDRAAELAVQIVMDRLEQTEKGTGGKEVRLEKIAPGLYEPG